MNDGAVTPVPQSSPTDDSLWLDWSNELAEMMPPCWDGDEAQEAIISDFVRHCIAEVQRLGGCLNRACGWGYDEPCDHGYLPEPVAAGLAGTPSTLPEGPRTFVLQRDEDATGISGTGVVAEGVVFSDGRCALRWTSEHRSTAVYDSLGSLVAIHGHNGATKVVWR